MIFGAAPVPGGAEWLWLEIMCGWGTCAGAARGRCATRGMDGMGAVCVMLGTEMRGDGAGGVTTRGAMRGAGRFGGETFGAANARTPPATPKCPRPDGCAAAGMAMQAAQ